jgi:hypothetical protein
VAATPHLNKFNKAQRKIFSGAGMKAGFYGKRVTRMSAPFVPLLVIFAIIFFFGAPAPSALAQAPSGTLRGSVTDPSGGAVVSATVLLTDAAGKTTTGQTSKTGAYEFRNLPAGNYGITVGAAGFALYQKDAVTITANQVQTLDVQLALEVQKQKVEVTDSETNVDVNPTNNASALVLKGKDLDALSDDPDELQSELTALAGPS